MPCTCESKVAVFFKKLQTEVECYQLWFRYAGTVMGLISESNKVSRAKYNKEMRQDIHSANIPWIVELEYSREVLVETVECWEEAIWRWPECEQLCNEITLNVAVKIAYFWPVAQSGRREQRAPRTPRGPRAHRLLGLTEARGYWTYAYYRIENQIATTISVTEGVAGEAVVISCI